MPDTKATSTNPKDLLGNKKIDLTRISAFAEAHEAFAMMDGRDKYGSYNWREKEVRAEIYVAACLRHIKAWYEGEEYASDSLAHHLGHARACLGILIDAMETGNLIDDRPVTDDTKGELARVMKELEERLMQRRAMRAGKSEGFLVPSELLPCKGCGTPTPGTCANPAPFCDKCGKPDPVMNVSFDVQNPSN